MSNIFYRETAGHLQTNSPGWVPIPALNLTLPVKTVTDNSALIILNVPNPYATGTNFPGGNFGITIDGAVLGPYASFTYDKQQPDSTGRKPTTLVIRVALDTNMHLVEAVWSSIRSSTVIMDSPSSLSAVTGLLK